MFNVRNTSTAFGNTLFVDFSTFAPEEKKYGEYKIWTSSDCILLFYMNKSGEVDFNPCFKIPSCFAKYYRICFFIYSFCSNNTVFNILQSRLHPHDAKKFSIKRLTYLHCFNLLSGWLKEMFRSNEFTNVLTFNPSILLSYHIMGLLLQI